MYENLTRTELEEAFGRCVKYNHNAERGLPWAFIICLFAVSGGVGGILFEGFTLYYGILIVIAMVAFMKCQSNEKQDLDISEQMASIKRELDRRSSWDSKIAESRISYTHRSRHYPSEKSWTKSPAWAFEIPLSEFIDANKNSVIKLTCEPENRNEPSHELLVPEDFLARNIESFYLRRDVEKISLFLSAEIETRFRELRGTGEVEFYEFLI